jgi:Arc/MetJ-type ribon-helix-helix transcriptional regulator
MVSVTVCLPCQMVRWLDRQKGSRAEAVRKILKEAIDREWD